MNAHATYEDESLKVEFSAYLERDNNMWDVLDVKIDGMEILGVALDVDKMPMLLQDKLYDLHNDLEFE
jgi:hypothetical protein